MEEISLPVQTPDPSPRSSLRTPNPSTELPGEITELLDVCPDFVLVWNETSEKATANDAFARRSVFEYNLEEEGLILRWENSDSEPDLHVIKIWAPLEVLKRYSEILKLRLPMKQLSNDDEDYDLNRKSELGFWKCCARLEKCITVESGVFPTKERKLTELYSRDKGYLFDVDESNMREIFPISVRARILSYILRRKPYKEEEELERDAFAFGIDRLIQQGVYEAAYPLHDGNINAEGTKRNLLYNYWARFSQSLKRQPLDLVRDYFGESIALYFAWLGFYAKMLVVAAVLGLSCFIYGIISTGGDQYIKDVCNKTTDYTMCPLCDNNCRYWKLSEKCAYSQFTHLFDNDSTVIYAILMSVWTAFFLEMWKRYSATITHKWDLSNFDLNDNYPRPEYVAALKRIYPNGTGEDGKEIKFDNLELTIPFWRRKLPHVVVSYSSVLLLVVLALGALVGVIIYRLWITLILSESGGKHRTLEWESLIVSVSAALINLTFIVIFGKVYERIAVKLTEIEYPRTQAEFEASYTLKVYLLQFVNNYSSIFYVAFFKGAYAGAPHRPHRIFGRLRQEECGLSCMPELCIQLAVIMIGKQTKSMFMELLLPFFKRTLKRTKQKLKGAVGNKSVSISISPSKRQSGKHGSCRCQWAEDYDLLEWGEFSLADEYLEMVLQFGFVTIFVAAFPLAPFFALINNIFELRVDAGKLLRHYRRPVGLRVKDIGVWSGIVDAIIKISVLSNALIIALTSNFIPKLVYRYFILDEKDPNYGTLNGYLHRSLTAFDTADVGANPGSGVVPQYCMYPTMRYSSTENFARKYEFKEEHWKIWLARVLFVVLYENVVAVMILIMRWIIPDMPSKLRTKIQREGRLVHDLILKQELLLSQKETSAHHGHARLSQQKEFQNRTVRKSARFSRKSKNNERHSSATRPRGSTSTTSSLASRTRIHPA